MESAPRPEHDGEAIARQVQRFVSGGLCDRRSWFGSAPHNTAIRGANQVEEARLLRRALRGVVPDAILDGPKTGFTVPYAEWLGGPLADYVRQVLLDPSTIAWGIFDQAALEQTISEHQAGKRNHGHILYKLLNLVLWRNAYLRVER